MQAVYSLPRNIYYHSNLGIRLCFQICVLTSFQILPTTLATIAHKMKELKEDEPLCQNKNSSTETGSLEKVIRTVVIFVAAVSLVSSL